MQKRTTFMIAHRLSTLRSCDTILVLERGKLIEVQTPGARKAGSMLQLEQTGAT
jgi:ABC-type multidrug transport system fused ATPase/permease subunit